MGLFTGAQRYMLVREAERWLGNVAAGSSRWSWQNENRKISAYIRKQTRQRTKAHASPEGVPWAERFIPTYTFEIGKPGPIRATDAAAQTRHDGYIWAYLHSARQVKRANRFGKAMVKARYGTSKKAIYRTGKNSRATKLRTALTANKAPGSLVSLGKDWLRYGLTPGWSKWAGLLHAGGTYKGKPVPARPLLGLTNADLKHIVNVYADGALRRAMKRQQAG